MSETEKIKRRADEYTKVFMNQFEKVDLSDITDAYIAGATENGNDWHFLKDTPNMLPPATSVDPDGIISEDVVNENGKLVYYDYNKKKWYDAFYDDEIEVNAWCKLPRIYPELKLVPSKEGLG